MLISRHLPHALLLTSAVLGSAALMPAEAYACTYPSVVIESTYPEPGAVNVPTNAVLFAYGPDLDGADDVALFDAAGNVVPIEVRSANPSGLDLIPLSELRADERYELRASASTELASITFTTGTGPAAVPERLEAPSIDVLLLEYTLGSCGEQAGICLDAAAPPGATLEVRVGEEVLSTGSGWPWPRYRAYGQALAEDDCVELRVRDVRGNRSEPSTACGDALRRVRLRSNLADAVYRCDNYQSLVEPSTTGALSEADQDSEAAIGALAGTTGKEPATSSSGCALTHAAAGRPSFPWLACGLAALLTARRWRRRGRSRRFAC